MKPPKSEKNAIHLQLPNCLTTLMAAATLVSLARHASADQTPPPPSPVHQAPALLPDSTGVAQVSGSSIGPCRSMSIESLRRGFSSPPLASGPWVYWMTFDNAITRAELSRELDVLVAAGFSGAEMRFLESPWLKDRFKTELSLTDHRRLEFLSPEFLDCLKSLCERAKQRGFKLGFNLGMGWPPGGTWITPEHQSKCLQFADAQVSGGQQLRLAVPEKASPAEMVFAWKVSGADGKQVERDSFTDITKHLAIDRRSLDWAAPPGNWLVGFFRLGPGGKLDKASGFAADPGSASAMRFHLDHVFSRLDAALSK